MHQISEIAEGRGVARNAADHVIDLNLHAPCFNKSVDITWLSINNLIGVHGKKAAATSGRSCLRPGHV